MGRLFWKFFLCIWLGQLAGVLGTGALFWVERHQAEAGPAAGGRLLPPEFRDRPPPGFAPGAPAERHPPPPPGRPPRGPLPVVPMIVGFIVSLLGAAGLAWYFAKPIRHLRRAFDAAAGGDLEVRIGHSMGGRRDELADLGADFDRMSERLQVVIDGQKRLLHDVSHEIRSPLARLHAAIGLARQQPARLEDSLQRIEHEGGRIDQLVGQLLTLSRLEAGGGGQPERIELGELLADIVDDARFEGAPRDVGIDYVPAPIAELRADPELLQRAIENVVRNAIRHSPAGGVVRIAAERSVDGVFRLSVADQGAGVPDNELDAIFRPFFRGERQAAGAGYGLGLAISQRVIAAVNGSIRAKNAPGGGLVVEIALPL